MKTLVFLFLHLVITSHASSIASPTKSPIVHQVAPPPDNGCIAGHYDMYIFNGMNAPFVVHIQSRNDDLGNRTVNVRGSTTWGFCLAFTRGTLFYAHFYENARRAFFDVYQYDTVAKYCKKAKSYGNAKCYWLVRDDGFYLSAHLNPFPNGWNKVHDWQ